MMVKIGVDRTIYGGSYDVPVVEERLEDVGINC